MRKMNKCMKKKHWNEVHKNKSCELKISSTAQQSSPYFKHCQAAVCLCPIDLVLSEEELVSPSSSSRGSVTDRPAELFTGRKSNLSLSFV